MPEASHCTLVWRNEAPPVAAFIEMRDACGWGSVTPQTAQAALDQGLHNVSVFDAETIVAFGRVIGDGALYFYLQDIVVDPAWRGRGLGHRIIAHLLNQIRQNAASGGMVGLMAAQGKEAFYSRHGFSPRPDGTLGAGMTLVL